MKHPSYSKANMALFPFCEVSKAIEFIETESRIVLSRFWGKRKWVLFNEQSFNYAW
jgi:hypothetical protein